MSISIKEIYESVKKFTYSLGKRIRKYKDCIVAILLCIDMLVYSVMLALGGFIYKANNGDHFLRLLKEKWFIPTYILFVIFVLIISFFISKGKEHNKQPSLAFLRVSLCVLLALFSTILFFFSIKDLPFINNFDLPDWCLKLILWGVVAFYSAIIYLKFDGVVNVLSKSNKKYRNREEKKDKENND